MKKIKILLLLLTLSIGLQAQTFTHVTADSVRVGKTTGLGGTSLYGKVYLKNVGLGLVSDSILTVLNGKIRKVPRSGVVDSTVYRTVANSRSLAETQTALNLKANLASPTFTGTPTAPTAAPGTNTTQLATTAFVTAAGTVTSVTGTANQITVIGTTAPVISLPSTITGLTSVTSTGFTGNLTGNASTVTTNANLTGDVVSTGNATNITTNAVINSDLAQMATKTYKGRTSALTGNAEDVPVATLKTDLALVKSDVGLGSVDNTTDAAKPVSTATQTALNLKQDAITAGTTLQYYRGDKTFQTLNTATVPELTNLYYTEARVSANTSVAENTAKVTNATHTGDADGATALTVKKINGVALSGLATGILKNTTTTGVPSIAIAADFPTLNQNTTGTALNVTGTVAIANGGTGSATKNFVDLTTTQTIAGDKTFSGASAFVSGNFSGSVNAFGDASVYGSFAPRLLLVGTGGTDSIVVYNTTNKTLRRLSPSYYLTPTGSGSGLTGTAAALNIGGNAATVTTNANLTGVVTSVGNATSIADAALTIGKTSGLQAALDAKLAATTASTTYAPISSKYIVQTADAALTGEQALGALATGILKNTTTTGVLSIAVAADFPTLNQSTTGNAATATALQTPDNLASITARGATTSDPIALNNVNPFNFSSATTIDFRPTSSATFRFVNNDYTLVNASLDNNGNLGIRGTVTASNLSGTNTGDQTNISGNAATVTTNANLTGPITSVGNATSIASQTGTGSTFVMNTSPTLVTPNIGNATGGTLSLSGALTSTLATGTFLQNTSGGTSNLQARIGNTGSNLYAGIAGSTGISAFAGTTNYMAYVGQDNNADFGVGTSGTIRHYWTGAGQQVIVTAPTTSAATYVLARNPTTGAVEQAVNSRQLEEWITDASNTGTTSTDLYTFVIPANTLVNTGDKLAFSISGIYGATSNSKTLTITFVGGFSPVASSSNGGGWAITGHLTKTSATTYRITVSKNDGSTSGVISGTGTSVDFTIANTFKLSATGGATGDIVAYNGYLEFKPAGL